VKILLADDHTMFAQGVESLLRDDFDSVVTVGDGEELVKATRELQPDLILVDISMPRMNGFDAVRRIRKEGSQTKIIFLTMHDDEALVAEAFRCGASAYVLKQAAGEELVRAIRQVLDGHQYVTSQIGNRPVELLTDRGPKPAITPRQREVLNLLSRGLTMKEIAKTLNISTRTAESHKYEMMESLGVETTAALIRYGLKLGLIT
jgi:DNA-binding NarL/FixJ family response regulator